MTGSNKWPAGKRLRPPDSDCVFAVLNCRACIRFSRRCGDRARACPRCAASSLALLSYVSGPARCSQRIQILRIAFCNRVSKNRLATRKYRWRWGLRIAICESRVLCASSAPRLLLGAPRGTDRNIALRCGQPRRGHGTTMDNRQERITPDQDRTGDLQRVRLTS